MTALLTSTEAGLILGKSARTVQRMVDAKVLFPVHKMPGPNGAYLFRREDIEAFRDNEPNGDPVEAAS